MRQWRVRWLALAILLAVLSAALLTATQAPQQTAASALPAAVLIERLQADPPGTWVVELRLPGAPEQPAMAWLQAPDPASAPQHVLVDRSSGAVLGAARTRWAASDWLDAVTSQLLIRPALCASALLLLYAAGVYAVFRRARAAAGPATAPPEATAGSAAPILVVWASQTGTAEAIAQQTHVALLAGGRAATLRPLQQLRSSELADTALALFVVSTYGEGDPPDQADRFVRQVMRHSVQLDRLRFGLLALGDRQYSQFCGFGHTLQRWLRAQGAQALFDPVEVDAADPAALRHWQSLLHALGADAATDWSAPAYQHWRLQHRDWLNAGSPGHPVFRVVLAPAEKGAPLPAWQAGDIAQIGPCHASAAVQQWMADTGLQERDILLHGQATTLSQALARHHWPSTAELAADDWLTRLKPLPHREYSIASLPAEGHLELLVRQQSDPQGRLGLGSGWLTAFAPLHAPIALRIRANSAFHPPPPSRPLILIGNGTGLAGLRAHLRARPAGTRNWLLYGERSTAHDLHYRTELATWQSSGHLHHLDLAFSRDTDPRMYVQDLLPAHAQRLLTWVQGGAAIYVCGSLEGMAPAVDAALERILGRDTLDQLVDEQRYRRDVY